jgi:hypothetical protein
MEAFVPYPVSRAEWLVSVPYLALPAELLALIL